MAYLELLSNINGPSSTHKGSNTTKIMVFTEGTVLGPKNLLHHFNHASYIPIKNAVNIIKTWEQQGSEIMYLTSVKRITHVQEIKEILLKNHFPGTYLFYRDKGQKYKDIVEQVVPDILVEDDCRSIGGKWQMSITYVKAEIKDKVKSIVVKEFKGIDSLPTLLSELLKF